MNEGGQPSGRPPGSRTQPPTEEYGLRARNPEPVGTQDAQDAQHSRDPLLALRPHRVSNARPILVPLGNIASIEASTLPAHSTLPDPRAQRPTTRSPADSKLTRARTRTQQPPFDPAWTLNPLIWAQLLSIRPAPLAHPPIEWFASVEAHVSRRFKHVNDSAWDYQWDSAHWSILLCPLDNDITRAVIDKCFRDGATATIITEHKPHEPWFVKLAAQAYLSADLPYMADTRLNIRDGSAAGDARTLCAFFIDCRTATEETPARIQIALPQNWRLLYRPIRSGLTLQLWEQLLQHHPDDAFVTRFLDTARHGAVTGYHGPRLLPRPCRNPRSTHTKELRRLRAVEASKDWRSGPFHADDPPLFNLICNPTKGVTKRGSDKVRHCVTTLLLTTTTR
jgi:hypothetical protein